MIETCFITSDNHDDDINGRCRDVVVRVSQENGSTYALCRHIAFSSPAASVTSFFKR